MRACPFCGGKPHSRTEADLDGFGRFYWFECGGCKARSSEKFATETCTQFYQEVRDAWNRRTDLTPPAADYVAGLEWAVVALAEKPGSLGYRVVQVSGGNKNEAIGCGLQKIEELNPGFTVHSPDALKIKLAARPASPDTRVVPGKCVHDPSQPEVGSIWRHVKSGHDYRVISCGIIESNLTPSVIYTNMKPDADPLSEANWIRPMAEFCDGRFVAIIGGQGQCK